MQGEPPWVAGVHQVLRAHAVRQISYVPDAGHARLIERCQADEAMITVGLTTEEEGVALAAGAWLGGQRSALLMQSSGVGNCVNMLSLPQSCRFPILVLVTMRGQFGETNPWQVPMGQRTAEILRLSGVITFEVEDPLALVETVDAAAAMAFSGPAAVAVTIGQRVIGAKAFAGVVADANPADPGQEQP